MTDLDDKTIVRDYCNSKGCACWRRSYGDGEVNKVQLDIRQGHQYLNNSALASSLPGFVSFLVRLIR